MNTTKELFCLELETKIDAIVHEVVAQNAITVSLKDVQAVVKQTVERLNPEIVNTQEQVMKDEIAEYIAKEYILFQLQGHGHESNFEDYLENFIYNLTNEINTHYQ